MRCECNRFPWGLGRVDREGLLVAPKSRDALPPRPGALSAVADLTLRPMSGRALGPCGEAAGKVDAEHVCLGEQVLVCETKDVGIMIVGTLGTFVPRHLGSSFKIRERGYEIQGY